MLFSTNVLGICLYPNAQFCSCSWARTKWNGKTFQGLNHVLLADQEGRVLQKQSYNDFEITPVKTRKYQRSYFFFLSILFWSISEADYPELPSTILTQEKMRWSLDLPYEKTLSPIFLFLETSLECYFRRVASTGSHILVILKTIW